MRRCEQCGTSLTRRRFPSGRLEPPTQFAQRRFCGLSCARKAEAVEFDLGYVVAEGGCWLWQRSRADTGYGNWVPPGASAPVLAHRYAWERVNGSVPVGLELDHLCRVRGCVNPEHLEPVTHAENARRGAKAKITHADAAEIRRRRAAGETTVALGEAFGLHSSQISRIARGLAWGAA